MSKRPREQYIENNIVRNLASVGCKGAPYVCRCRMGRGYGIVDVAITPTRGSRRLVLVEAKQIVSPDAASKVVGQLFMYYTAALKFGEEGLGLIREFAVRNPPRARKRTPKSLKMLSGGISPPDAAWKRLQEGRKLRPDQVGLFIALDDKPPTSLVEILTALRRHHRVTIGVVSVLKADRLIVWRPR